MSGTIKYLADSELQSLRINDPGWRKHATVVTGGEADKLAEVDVTLSDESEVFPVPLTGNAQRRVAVVHKDYQQYRCV